MEKNKTAQKKKYQWKENNVIQHSGDSVKNGGYFRTRPGH